MNNISNLSEQRVHSLLNMEFQYPEGLMSRKQWLETKFAHGFILTGNELSNGKEFIELNATEKSYYEFLEDYYTKELAYLVKWQVPSTPVRDFLVSILEDGGEDYCTFNISFDSLCDKLYILINSLK